MGKISGLADTDVFVKTPWFEIGEYKVKIVAVKLVESKQHNSKLFFVIECEILESSCATLEAGTVASQRIDMSQKMGNPNVKAFLAAACGCDPSGASKDEMNQAIVNLFSAALERPCSVDEAAELACSDANPFGGRVMGLQCFNTKTKAQTDFTVHRWYPLGDEEQARLAGGSRSIIAAIASAASAA